MGIRPYEPADARPLFEAARESTGDVFPWLPWCHPRYSIEEARSWIQSQIEARQTGQAFEFVITDSGRFAGGCGLNQINAEHRVANLGYWVRSSAAGRGLAPAAVTDLAAWGFENTGLQRLEILVAVGNQRSHRVAQKAGALREGVLRKRILLHGQAHDAAVYSLVREEWIRRKSGSGTGTTRGQVRGSRRLHKIVSGGQSGADQAALDVALERGLAIGGWVPKGRLAEDGTIPERYAGLREAESSDPALRTALNVRDSDATLIVSRGPLSGGSLLTSREATRLGRPVLHLDLALLADVEAVAELLEWLQRVDPLTLHVAGPRASHDAGIGERVAALLRAALPRPG